MKQYWKAIWEIYHFYWINMILWPSLDLANDKIWTSNETIFSKNDRSFSNKPRIVSELWNAFIKWTMDVNWFISVPKHFVWVWLVNNNTDKETAINERMKEWAILPFKNYINMHEINWRTLNQIKSRIKTLIKKWRNKEANKLKIQIQERLHNYTTPIIMVWNNNNNFYDNIKTPGSLSHKTISAIKERLSTTNIRHLGWLWEDGIVMTDDLNTGSIRSYLQKYWNEKNKSYDFSEATKLAIEAWNDILLYWDADTNSILNGIKTISRRRLLKSAKKILELKVYLWIYEKKWNKYILNPKMYNPTASIVEEDWDNSRISPIDRSNLDQEYENENNKITPISLKSDIYMWAKDYILNACRINPNKLQKMFCSIHPNMYDSYLSPNESKLSKKLIVVDKSELKMYIYNFNNRALIEEINIGVWRWTKAISYLKDKKIPWDKKTPVGYYMVVQKKDPERIKKTIESKYYNAYWWDKWGMIVLAWPWNPQIAIHWTDKESTWAVSSWCIRVNNAKIQEFLNNIPLGSMVLITN